MIDHSKHPTIDTNDEKSKDEYFLQVADLANSMIKQHGKDFAMGTLVLAARFIAEDKPLHHNSQKNEAAH